MAPHRCAVPTRRQAVVRLCRPDVELESVALTLRSGPEAGRDGQRLVESAVREIEGARWCSVTVANQTSLVTALASGPLARRVDRMQVDAGQGPSLPMDGADVVAVHSADLARDRRWPRFGALAADAGAAAVLSYRILTAPRHVASLNIYADRSYTFDDDDDLLGRLLADHLAGAWGATGPGQPPAFRARDVIGRATGMLQERLRLTDRQAFAVLLECAHRAGSSLRDVAEHLSATGRLPS